MEGVILALIQLCILVAIVYVVFWVIGSLGIALPHPIPQIVWIIVALIALLFLFRNVLPGLGLRVFMVGGL